MLSRLVIGSRKSALAKLQSYLVKKNLLEKYPNLEIEFYFKESSGDIDLTSPLWKLSGKGVFTRDFREDLLNETVDVVIHSWKDLDLEGEEGTEIISVLSRADARDLLIFKKDFLQSKSKLRFFSSSPRREYNLKSFFKKALPSEIQNLDIEFEPVRGNIQTRLKKWSENSETAGLIIAKAAIDRILSKNFPESNNQEYTEIREFIQNLLSNSFVMVLPLSENPNAPAQGALAAEIKKGREEVKNIFLSLHDTSVAELVQQERKVLSSYGGGCHQKIGVSFLKKQNTIFKFLRGETDSGITLNESKTISEKKHPKALSIQNIFPNQEEKISVNRKEIQKIEIPREEIWFISRSNSFPKEFHETAKTKIIWTAGLKTWFDLAKENIWVTGTSDSLGEDNLELDIIFPNCKIIKFTHKDSESIQTSHKRLYTYEVDFNSLPEYDLKEKTHFYWMSASQFDYFIEKYPFILDKNHSCGVGLTYSHILNKIQNPEKVDIFYNYKEWLEYHK